MKYQYQKLVVQSISIRVYKGNMFITLKDSMIYNLHLLSYIQQNSIENNKNGNHFFRTKKPKKRKQTNKKQIELK